MEQIEFVRQVELLTGSPVKGQDQIDSESLRAILRDDNAVLDCSNLNELLLLVHKDRVEKPLFNHFFGEGCRVGDIPSRIAGFQRVALLLYGNFVFAYRTLSRIKGEREFAKKISAACKDVASELSGFRDRKPGLLEIDRIERNLTPFVGYLSARAVPADLRSCEFRMSALVASGQRASWENWTSKIGEMANPSQRESILEIVLNYRYYAPSDGIDAFQGFLDQSFIVLQAKMDQIKQVRNRATKNQNVYLTWDHMDVYFATSMRKSWEYKDLYDFIDKLMKSDEFADST